MGIPWKSWGRKALDYLLILVRATAPDKSTAREVDEPSATDAFDRWKDGRP